MITEELLRTHSVCINSSKLEVYDNLLPTETLKSLHLALMRSDYVKSLNLGYDQLLTDQWSTKIDLDITMEMPIFRTTVRVLEEFRSSDTFELFEACINVSSFGDTAYAHVDCGPQSGSLTAIWFICEKWNHEWGGEIIFFDNTNDARAAVLPRPGRLVIFDGNILHTERPPSRICFNSRYTLAMKFRMVGRKSLNMSLHS